MWDFIAAGRVDKHSQMTETFFSPRAAIVFKPAANQNFRLTFNRAFSTPANFSFFLDLPQAITPFAPIRALGVPSQGMQFDRTATGGAGGLYMRTSSLFPAAAGGPNQRIPANAIAGYPIAFGAAVAGGLKAGLQGAGLTSGQADAVIAALGGITSAQLTASQVGTVLKLFDPASARRVPSVPFPTVVDPTTGVTDVARLKATFHNTVEAGYKGGLADNKLLLSVDGWWSKQEHFVTASQNITPNVFFDPVSLKALYTAALTPSFGPAAATIAGAVAGGVASVPLGTVVPEAPNSLTNRNDVIFTYRNLDKSIALWGSDVAADLQMTDKVGLLANYSFVNKDKFPELSSGVDTFRINAPKNKGAVALRYRDEITGFSGEVRGRFTQAFKVNSGVYVGDVPANNLLDALVTYRLPMVVGAAISLSGTNLLNDVVPSFIGVPAIGRMLMTRLQYAF